MFEFLTVLMATLVVFYVASPLMQRQKKAQQISSEADLKLSSTLHQQGVLQNTIDDLEFDYQTGKLSTTDYESMVAEHRKSLRQIDERLKKLGGVCNPVINFAQNAVRRNKPLLLLGIA